MTYISNIIKIEEDELMKSYFTRLAYANGFPDVKSFFKSFVWKDTEISENINRRLKNDGIIQVEMIEKSFNNELNTVDFFFKTSIYNGVRPFIDNAMEIILYVFRERENEINVNPKDYAKNLRYCPVCVKDDMKKHGYFWYRRAHNMPGTIVCHKHKCMLKYYNEKDMLVGDIIQSNMKHEVEYSRFTKNLLEAEIDCDKEEIKKIIRNQIIIRGYDISMGGYGKFVSSLLKSEFESFISLDLESFLKTGMKVFSEEKCSILLRLLYVIFGNVENLKKIVCMNNDYLNLKKSYEVVDYSKGIYRLRHKKCNKVFISTKKAFESGWDCPYCNNLSKQENIIRNINLVGNNDYEVINKPMDKVLLRHNLCGETKDFELINSFSKVLDVNVKEEDHLKR